MVHRVLVRILVGSAPLFPIACKSRETLSTVRVKGGLESPVSIGAIKDIDLRRSICSQNTVILFTGNGESLGEVYFRTAKDEERFGKSEVKAWRRAERAREWDYYQKIMSSVEDLRTRLRDEEKACTDLFAADAKQGRSVSPGSVTLIALTDGPNFDGVDGPPMFDSQIESWHYGYERRADGIFFWPTIKYHQWEVSTSGQLIPALGEGWEGLLPDLYKATLAGLERISTEYLHDDAVFSRSVFVYKSHGAPLLNRWWNEQRLPKIHDLLEAPRPQGNFETVALLDSVGAGGEKVMGNTVMMLWSPETLCKASARPEELAVCVCGADAAQDDRERDDPHASGQTFAGRSQRRARVG